MIDEILFGAEEKMEKAVAVAKEEFGTIRTGRAHPAMFGKITAEYYGTQTPVNQLASFHIPEPRMVVVQPFDKSSLAAIEKAIRNSDLGVNPSNDGAIIRVIFPELSEERRIAEQMTREEGKPEQAIGRIVEGRLGAFFKDVVLTEQAFIKDPKKTIKQVLSDQGVTVQAFARFQVGQAG